MNMIKALALAEAVVTTSYHRSPLHWGFKVEPISTEQGMTRAARASYLYYIGGNNMAGLVHSLFTLFHANLG